MWTGFVNVTVNVNKMHISQQNDSFVIIPLFSLSLFFTAHTECELSITQIKQQAPIYGTFSSSQQNHFSPAFVVVVVVLFIFSFALYTYGPIYILHSK